MCLVVTFKEEKYMREMREADVLAEGETEQMPAQLERPDRSRTHPRMEKGHKATSTMPTRGQPRSP